MLIWNKKIEYKGSYHDRKTRCHFCLSNFNEYFKGSILDVGCDKAYLKTLLTNNKTRYVGIDKYGTPDIYFDLEGNPLPFKDQEFDIVCCLDVLEHLDNPYLVFDELARVSKKFILISLPNNFHLYERISLMRGKVPNKFYGLPSNAPQDRHKWFFNIIHATEFIKYRSTFNGFRIKKDFPFYRIDGRPGIAIDMLLKKFGLLPMLFVKSYWVLLERQE